MSAITEAITTVVNELRAAGLVADSDPRNLNLPAVWVTLDTLDLVRLSGGSATVTVGLTAIVPDTGYPATLAQLDQLTAAVNDVYPGLSWDTQAVLLPTQSPTPLPALTTTIDLEWSRS